MVFGVNLYCDGQWDYLETTRDPALGAYATSFRDTGEDRVDFFLDHKGNIAAQLGGQSNDVLTTTGFSGLCEDDQGCNPSGCSGIPPASGYFWITQTVKGLGEDPETWVDRHLEEIKEKWQSGDYTLEAYRDPRPENE